MVIILNINTWISEATAEPPEERLEGIINEPAESRGKQLTKNYHELSYALSNEIKYHRLSWRIMNDSWW